MSRESIAVCAISCVITPLPFYLGKVARTAQKPVGDTRRAAGTLGQFGEALAVRVDI